MFQMPLVGTKISFLGGVRVLVLSENLNNDRMLAHTVLENRSLYERRSDWYLLRLTYLSRKPKGTPSFMSDSQTAERCNFGKLTGGCY